MRYDRMVIAYHGCDAKVAERILRGAPFRKSQNDYDWLGEGIYFWEYGADRALQFAREQHARGKVKRPTIVGALIQLGNCFDLMDTKFTRELASAYGMLQNRPERVGIRLNYYLDSFEPRGIGYDSVRCGFVEGEPAFEGSGIHQQSHVQLAVRNPGCIVGTFRPTI